MAKRKWSIQYIMANIYIYMICIYLIYIYIMIILMMDNIYTPTIGLMSLSPPQGTDGS